MIDPIGVFRTTIEVAPLHDAEGRHTLAGVMVDTGSEYNWVPAGLLTALAVNPVRTDRFETADGRILERDVGFALFFAAGRSSPAVAVCDTSVRRVLR